MSAPKSFRPPPKVMSTFVRIMPKPNLLPLRSRDALVIVLRSAFQQRRKTLRNALQSLSIDWNRVVSIQVRAQMPSISRVMWISPIYLRSNASMSENAGSKSM